MDACIIDTLSYGPLAYKLYTDLENQDSLINRTLMIGHKVSITHRFH